MVPKLNLVEFHQVAEPISEPVTKFGGQPTWLEEPQWPMNDGWDPPRPMRFLAQIALDPQIFGTIPAKMAYVFITHGDFDDPDFFDPDICFPDEGANAVILQP